METTRALVTNTGTLTDAEYVAERRWRRRLPGRSDGNAAYYLLQAAEKTYATFELTARNPGGHSSLPRDDNAIYDLAAALQNIAGLSVSRRIATKSRAATSRRRRRCARAGRSAMRAFAHDPADEDAQAVLERCPPKSA